MGSETPGPRSSDRGLSDAETERRRALLDDIMMTAKLSVPDTARLLWCSIDTIKAWRKETAGKPHPPRLGGIELLALKVGYPLPENWHGNGWASEELLVELQRRVRGRVRRRLRKRREQAANGSATAVQAR